MKRFAGDSGARAHCQVIKEHQDEILPLHYELLPFDFTQLGRLGVCELMAERRQELRFPIPLTHSCQFAISRSAHSQQIFLRRCLQIEN